MVEQSLQLQVVLVMNLSDKLDRHCKGQFPLSQLHQNLLLLL